MTAPTFFDHREQFRHWLERHAATSTELLVGFHKVATQRARMTWSESVDEALCFGWIDGVRKRIDEGSYQIRFTPRKQGSIWSLVNVGKVGELTRQNRMQPIGIAAFESRVQARTGVYSFEREEAAALTPVEVREFQQHRQAWTYFQSAAPSYQRAITHWVVSAKQAATRDRRFAQLVQACAVVRRTPARAERSGDREWRLVWR